MAELGNFLKYLDRKEVEEVVFQSGAVVSARMGGQLHPLTKEELSPAHIIKLLQPTTLIGLVPVQDGATPATPANIEGRAVVATLLRSGSMLMVRIQSDRTPAQEAAAVNNAQPSPGGVPDGTSPVTPPPSRQVQPAPVAAAAPEPAAVAAPVAAPAAVVRPVPVPHVSEPPRPQSKELTALLQAGRRKAASDVHIMSGEPAKFRIFGELIPETDKPLSHEEIEAMIKPLLNSRNRKQLEEAGYADFAAEVEGAGRLRVNVCRQKTGLKGCFRLIMEKPPTLESLSLPHELRELLNYHQGLVVISGPNGAGKTTTFSALVDLFNAEKACHVITVEDPVEIMHPIKKGIVSQREIGAHTNSFHSALKGSLREDPDVIGIGELRDRETVEKAMEAAETGHLVFATMSTPNGATTIDRLIDMFPPDDQSQVRSTLAGALKFVISQRLVPLKDGSGRIVAVEMLTGNLPLWNLIRDDKLFQLPSLQQRGRAFGMIRIEDSLNDLIEQGLIDEEVAKTFADDARAIGKRPVIDPAAEAEKKKKKGRGFFNKKGG